MTGSDLLTAIDRCHECLLPFGLRRMDGTIVEDARHGAACSRCTPCRNECGCDSEEAHDAAMEESRLAFLRDTGAMPAGWDAETMARVERAIAKARAEAGIK